MIDLTKSYYKSDIRFEFIMCENTRIIFKLLNLSWEKLFYYFQGGRRQTLLKKINSILNPISTLIFIQILLKLNSSKVK